MDNDTELAAWNEQELQEQRQRAEELIELCRRAPLDPMLLPSWTFSDDPF